MTRAQRICDPAGYLETERAKLQVAIDEFQARKISDDVFRACLYSRGFRGQALSCEFRLQDQIRYDNESEPT